MSEKLREAFEKGVRKGNDLIHGSSTIADWRRYWFDQARGLAIGMGCPVEDVVRRVIAFHRERLDAVPELTRYSELRGYRDLLLEEERGMRAAGVDDELLALSRSLHFWRGTRLLQETGIAYDADATIERCRILYLADSDRGALHLKNADDTLTYWKPKPPIADGSPWPFTHPLVFDGVSAGLHIDEIPPEIFPVDVQELCLRHCATVDEAEEFMVKYNYFWGGQNLLVHDYDGNSVAFEKTWCRVATRRANSAGINFINGVTAVDPGLNRFRLSMQRKWLDQIGQEWNNSPDGCYFAHCQNQGRNIERYVEDLSHNPTWDNAKQLMEQRDRSGPMCLTGEKSHPDQVAAACTLQMRIFEIDNKRLHLRQWRGDVPAYLDTPEVVQFV